jgi:hypothetical protein
MVDPISQDEQPIRQTKPSNLPQEEDLSSPPVKNPFSSGKNDFIKII